MYFSAATKGKDLLVRRLGANLSASPAWQRAIMRNRIAAYAIRLLIPRTAALPTRRAESCL